MRSKFTSEENSTQLNKLYLSITQNLSVENDMKEFATKIDFFSQNFFYKLSEKFPQLTANEKKLCALIRLNLSNKEIATLINSNTKTVEMARYRLRKKLELNQEVSLNLFLNKI